MIQISEREMEVLQTVASGKPPKQAAEELFVGMPTIRVHLSNLIAKFGVRRSREVVDAYLAHPEEVAIGRKPYSKGKAQKGINTNG